MALVKPPVGLTKALTPEEKKIINDEITRKMVELEETGLSREEIILSKSQVLSTLIIERTAFEAGSVFPVFEEQLAGQRSIPEGQRPVLSVECHRYRPEAGHWGRSFVLAYQAY